MPARDARRVELYLSALGFERALVDELARLGVDGARVLVPGVVGAEGGAIVDAAFARQVAPAAKRVDGASINALAQGALDVIIPGLDDDLGPLRLDVITPDGGDDGGVLERRAALVETRLRALLSEKRRRAFRRLDPRATRVIQVWLVAHETAWVSLASATPVTTDAPWPSPFPGGRAPIADDWDAPSSAYRKLREGLAWLGRTIAPGDRVVDLGASPGGWSHVALAAGAHVRAVDKAELDPRVAAHPRLVHLKKDAFTWLPEDGPVDWLLCDVIAAPERSYALLERWAEARAFRGLVFHLKFKGDADYARVDLARETLSRLGYGDVRAKKLVFDKHEVTLLVPPPGRAYVTPEPPPPTERPSPTERPR